MDAQPLATAWIVGKSVPLASVLALGSDPGLAKKYIPIVENVKSTQDFKKLLIISPPRVTTVHILV